MMVSRDVIGTNILFDERLHFMQHEDVDFCLQVLNKGFSVYAVPHIPLVHKEHGTFNYYKYTYDSDFEQNWTYLMNKWGRNKLLFENVIIPSLTQKESKKTLNATFYDLI